MSIKHVTYRPLWLSYCLCIDALHSSVHLHRICFKKKRKSHEAKPCRDFDIMPMDDKLKSNLVFVSNDFHFQTADESVFKSYFVLSN